MTRVQILAAVSVFACAALVASAQGRGGQGRAGQPQRPVWPPVLTGPAPGEVEVLPVQGQIYMVSGAGANITLQAGEQGRLLVDTGTEAMADKVIAAIDKVSKRPLRYIINTTDGADHIGGNAKIAPTGEIVPFREPNYTAGPQGALDVHKASVISYLTV